MDRLKGRTRALVIAFLQERKSVAPVISSLDTRRWLRSATVQFSSEGRSAEASWVGSRYLMLIVAGAFGIFAAITARIAAVGFTPYEWWLHLAGTVVAASAGGWAVARLLHLAVARGISRRFRLWVLKGESLVVVSVPASEAATAGSLLSETAGEHPAVFVLYPDEPPMHEAVDRPQVPVGEGKVHARAARLAQELKQIEPSRAHRTLTPRLDYCERVLKRVQDRLNSALSLEQGVALSAEWLLDNAYVIQGHIEAFRRNLPAQFYRELPIVKAGAWAGQARVYAIAAELVADWDGALTKNSVESFLQMFQSETVLTTAELWALPMMLRLRLIEYLASLAVQVERRQSEGELAAFWANRMLYAARREPGRLPEIIAAVAADCPAPSPHMAQELLDHLYDEEAALTPVRAWLQAKFPAPLDEVVRQLELSETADQASLANSISTLRLLSQFDWREVFEAVSHLEAILWTDPAQVYGQMDFGTRDLYRHRIEDLSREERVAEEAVALARRGLESPKNHVGYYLVDDGLEELLDRLKLKAPLAISARNWITRHAAPIYFASTLFGTVLFISGGLLACATPIVSWMGLLLVLLFVLPATEMSVQLVNFLVTRTLPPRPLPKMSFKDGVPEQFRTLVVVPMMLLTPDSIRDEVERLEIRALANPDENLRFGLLSDFSDAPSQRMPEDLELLEVAVKSIESLNERHGTDVFVLFYRERRWSESERCWMGWERKRGKLEELNRFLTGQQADGDTVKLVAGSLDAVDGVSFIITLDSDTQLPRDTARNLVASLAHPLNRPQLSQDGRRVERGYTLIQPRSGTSLPSATASLFARIFTDPAGIDPYTRAVSNVYQDLAASGTFHGTGIYDLHAFNKVLSGRFPESHLLSHDLIEGGYVRVAQAGEELLDVFPETYSAFCARQHRWIRGDWQVVDWLLPTVPVGSEGKREPNPLSLIDRWKVFDNLRRSLMPVAIVAMLVIGCAISPRAFECALLAGVVLLSPLIFPLADRLTRRWTFDPVVWQEPALNLARSALFAAVLPHQAWISLSAIARVYYRRAVSHRELLQWTTASSVRAMSQDLGHRRLLELAWVPLFAVLAVALAMVAQPAAVSAILPFAVLWFLSPGLIAWLDRPLEARPVRELSASDRVGLRMTARETWRFFDEFVGDRTHHLPPDNFQETHRVELAERTSPTNIGLYLASVLAAHDFGYVTPDQVAARIGATMETLQRMERFRGHLLNWYETGNLQPLGDRYVSMVDSGNLLGVLWAMEAGLRELIDGPLVGHQLFAGMEDALALANEYKGANVVANEHSAIESVLAGRPKHLHEVVSKLRSLLPLCDKLIVALEGAPERSGYWAKQLKLQAETWTTLLDRYFGWLPALEAPPEMGLISLGASAHSLRREAMERIPSLQNLADGVCEVGLLIALRHSANLGEGDVNDWLNGLEQAFESAQKAARETLDSLQSSIRAIEDLDRAMEMGFLYDPERRLFAIGYNIAEQRLDHSYYDLLASEARVGSFVAIARGDVPTEHWWALGRPFGVASLRRPLLSWNGTMFEYLMPLLLTKSYAHSLLDMACRPAGPCQIAYAHKRGIPWGVSESAYSALDSRQIYQYRGFGVPMLALKRGLEEDFVVSPYSSALALLVDPRAAAKNLRRNGVLARLGLRGQYGFYESIDFTRQHEPQGERGLVVHTFMAHHQGMLLVAIGNAICDDAMQRRFHSDPRVHATASLLYERVPVAPPEVRTYSGETKIARLSPIVSIPAPGRVDTADTPTPRTCLLSNGGYSVMFTNAGGGYSRWREFDITRWRADTTCDNWGKFCYLKDLDSGFVWSATHHPKDVRTSFYRGIFSAEMAEVRRRDRGIECMTEIVVAPEDDVEVWRLTLINRSQQQRRIEVTTYAELALAQHSADRSHPAFNKLFVETAMLRDLDALLAWRRLRSPDETPVWAAHVISSDTRAHEATQFETDRAKFIGRGRTVRNPIAMESALTGAEGYVLDPIFSLRRIVVLEPGERTHISLVTMAAPTRDQVIGLIAKYRDPEASDRAFQLAWTQAQLELRHLRRTPADAQLYQQLASHILFPHAHLRAPSERIVRNRLGQRDLWAFGISGDLPIVVLTVGEAEQLDVVDDLLCAHAFWRLRGLKCDLVILNEEAAGYEQPLQVQLQRLVWARAQYTGTDQPGGVFLIRASQIDPEGVTLIVSAAHAVLVAARGPLTQQIGLPSEAIIPTDRRIRRARMPEEPSWRLEPMDLVHATKFGGFLPDGREYVVDIGKGVRTPRPWSNVLANEQFGALVTDSGSGFAWSRNSQSFKLTPWSNDPVSDGASEAIYLYDPDLDALWTPTPLPIREDDAYRTRHGQGYTVTEHNSHAINQELTTFVPVDRQGGLPVRIQKLRLTNRSSRRRKLNAYLFSEWALSADREVSQLHVVTNWDLQTASVFARNSFDPTYAGAVAFAASTQTPHSFTGDRTEVLGRNGSLADPKGLRVDRLGGKCGGGFDPCACLQVAVTLEPDESCEIAFLIGATRDVAAARALVQRLRRPGEVDRAFQLTRQYWEDFLGAITVDTPDTAADLLINRWLPYQVLSCRLWGRSGFYQAGGAFGFRDQLQDVLALLYSRPELARAHILRSAARQFVEGDVQHWWHPETGAGVRTRISDDLLWLPFAVAHYVRVTGDRSILEEDVPFIEGRLLDKGEHDAYYVPSQSPESAHLMEHLRRAIEKGFTCGAHGLPLIGGGDWNDGMNLVGIGGKGESVWLAWFLVQALNDYAELLEPTDPAAAASYRKRAEELVENIEATAWDGEWYRRAYFDDGSPLGSKSSPEAQIDSLPQSWAAITGAGSRERAETAMRSAVERLVRGGDKLALLFTPPFDTSNQQPGYIKGYPPGVRENGGQYTHGSVWLALAWARLGMGQQAVQLLQLMNPVTHGAVPEQYMVEPYVAAADVYALPGKVGMGGWTWYTGSAAWMYRVWLEEVLGFKLRGDRLFIEPVVPEDWPGFKLRYRFRSTNYQIEVENRPSPGDGTAQMLLDGQPVTDGVHLVDDGVEHTVSVRL
jgi:cellobiose phosphorylase